MSYKKKNEPAPRKRVSGWGEARTNGKKLKIEQMKKMKKAS